MKSHPFSHRQIGLTAALLTAGTWSLLAIFLKYALRFSDSYSIVWYRMFVAFAVLLAWTLLTGRKGNLRVFNQRPGLLLIASLGLACNYLGFLQGVHFTSPANAQVFIQVGPLLLALAGLYFFKERLNRRQIQGLGVCAVGFALFFSDRLVVSAGNHRLFFVRISWILFGAVTWAIFASLQKRLLTRWKSSQINLYVYLVSAILFLPLADWATLSDLPLSVHFFYIFLGLNTVLAYGCLSLALQHLPATQVSPIITLNPLLTLFFIFIIEQMQWGFIPADPIGWRGYSGAVAAITGVCLVLSRPKVQRK